MNPVLLAVLLLLLLLLLVAGGLPLAIWFSEYLLSGGERAYALIPLLAAVGMAVYVLYLMVTNQRRPLFFVFIMAFPLISTLHRRVEIKLMDMEFYLETLLILVLGAYLWQQRRIRLHGISGPVFFTLALFLCALLSALLNHVLNPDVGWFMAQEFLLPFLMFFMALSLVRNRQDLHRVLQALLISLLVFAALSLTWVFVLDQTINLDVGEVLSAQTRISGGVRRFLVGAGFVNSEVGNRVFVLLLPVAAVLIQGRAMLTRNLFNYAIILISVYFIIATEHRAALLGAVVVFLLFLVFGRTRNVKVWMKLAVFALAFFFLHDKIGEYLSRRILLNESIMMDGSAQKRLIMWSFALDLFKGHPFFGIGPLQYLPAALNTNAQAITPHNYYMTLLAEVGSLGLLGYLGIVASLFVRGWRNARRLLDPALRRLNFGLLAGIFYYQFVLFFGGGRLTHNNSIYIHSLFWLLASLLWLMPFIEREERATALATANAADPPSAGRVPSEPPASGPGDAGPTDPGF